MCVSPGEREKGVCEGDIKKGEGRLTGKACTRVVTQGEKGKCAVYYTSPIITRFLIRKLNNFGDFAEF